MAARLRHPPPCVMRSGNITRADTFPFPSREPPPGAGQAEGAVVLQPRGRAGAARGAGGSPRVLLLLLSTGNSKLNCQKRNCPVIHKATASQVLQHQIHF